MDSNKETERGELPHYDATVRGMADCMDMVWRELVEAGVIDQTTPPMFVAEGVLSRLDGLRNETLVLRRRLAGETLRADLAEARAASKSQECIELRERMAARPAIPRTPEQAIAFIGNQFENMEEAEHLDNVRFQLTVHDLLSAFDWWAYDEVEPSDGAIYEAVSRRADPAAHDAAVAESLALFGSSAVLTPEHKAAQQGLNAAASQRLESVTVTDKDGWIRVKDQKPPFDQLVLVYKEDASKRTDVRWGVAERRRGGRYNPQEWLVEVPWEWAPIGTPTHWRPLPLLPGAQAVGVDPSKRTPDLYTCIGKGGSYELLDVAFGAGTSRDKSVVLYRDTENGALYFRTPDDFDKRMQKIEDPA